ncbi:uncharacterized protein FOMMEDRAFT_18440, partial [Fomitiporia mediterranea MF3/22]|uniref:uncharacterized protein n=1 Tax=Fomitiporia mediterranea (strain MF3/22) TaxID=694068 RepID=UPI00044097AF
MHRFVLLKFLHCEVQLYTHSDECSSNHPLPHKYLNVIGQLVTSVLVHWAICIRNAGITL